MTVSPNDASTVIDAFRLLAGNNVAVVWTSFSYRDSRAGDRPENPVERGWQNRQIRVDSVCRNAWVGYAVNRGLIGPKGKEQLSDCDTELVFVIAYFIDYSQELLGQKLINESKLAKFRLAWQSLSNSDQRLRKATSNSRTLPLCHRVNADRNQEKAVAFFCVTLKHSAHIGNLRSHLV